MLLDTNALLWVLTRPEKLGRQFRQRLENAGWAFFSPVSTFELRLLAFKRQGLVLPDNLDAELAELAIHELPYNQDATNHAGRFTALANTDPFDWMLVGQAAAAECDFYTSDRRLLKLGLAFVKDATI